METHVLVRLLNVTLRLPVPPPAWKGLSAAQCRDFFSLGALLSRGSHGRNHRKGGVAEDTDPFLQHLGGLKELMHRVSPWNRASKFLVLTE